MVDASLVMRLELADGAKLQAFIDGLIEEAGESIPIGTLGGQRYYRVVYDDALLAVAIQPTGLVVAVLPTSAEAYVLPNAFHQQKPDKSIVDTGALREVVAEYGLIGTMPGYVDLHQLVTALTTTGSPLSSFLNLDLSAACREEVRSLATISPRWILGYTRLDGDAIDGLSVLELRSDLATDLQGLTHPVPMMAELGRARLMMGFGVGLDMSKTLAWLEKTAARVTTSPYRCEWFADLNSLAEETSDLATDAPPWVAGFNGFLLGVSELAEGAQPLIAGYAYAGFDDPEKIAKMARGLEPSLANLKLSADGKPVEIPAPVPDVGAMYAAMTSRWIGVSVGGDKDREAMTAGLRAPATTGGPFAVIVYDYSRLVSAAASPWKAAGETDFADFAERLFKRFGRLVDEFYFTDRGIAVRYRFELR